MVIKKEIIIKKKTLNNKTRKGDYYYIKRKGGKPAYYKIKQGISIDNYLLAYDGKVKIKKKGVVRFGKESPADKYLKKTGLKKYKIDKLISKGITETSLNNIGSLNITNAHSAYKRMLSPLVKDKELINILSLDENVRKFKHRIQTNIVLESNDGKVEIELKTFNKTLIDVRSDFRNIISKEGVFEKDLKNIREKGYNLAKIPRGFDLKNYEKNLITKGLKIKRIKLRFVKGK